MSYQKQNFANGEVLTASQLNHIENGIADLESNANTSFAGKADKSEVQENAEKISAESARAKAAESAINETISTIIDPTLSVSGKAADAKMTGDKIGELKEDLGGLENDVYYISDNLIDNDKIIKGKKIHGCNAGQNINDALTVNKDWVTFNLLEPKQGIAYIFVYNLNKSKHINANVDIFNADGSYSRTINLSTLDLLTLSNNEKYCFASLNISEHPLLGTEMIIPKRLDFTEYIPHKILLFEKEDKKIKEDLFRYSYKKEKYNYYDSSRNYGLISRDVVYIINNTSTGDDISYISEIKYKIKDESVANNVTVYLCKGNKQTHNFCYYNKFSFTPDTTAGEHSYMLERLIPVYPDTYIGIKGKGVLAYSTDKTSGTYTKGGLYEGDIEAIKGFIPFNYTKDAELCFALCIDLIKFVKPKNEKQLELNILNFSGDGIKYNGFIGRWFPKKVNEMPCMVTLNSGSEIWLRVNGVDDIFVYWENMITSTVPYYAYQIDFGDVNRCKITDRIIHLSNNKEHIIRIVTDGINENVGKWTNEIGYALQSIMYDGAGNCELIQPNAPIIAFFGDSITEGIRALGISDDMSDTNSATNAFPWFCCEKLNAISYRVGFGASGIISNGSFRNLEDTLDYLSSTKMTTLGSDYYSAWCPNLIVINHGTNDSSADSAIFKDKYLKALARIKTKYPFVKIICMRPFNGTKATEIKEAVEETDNCIYVDTNGWGVTYTDGIHPNKDGAKKAGEQLASIISEQKLLN